MAGRPPVLTPDTLQRIRALTADGATAAETAERLRISPRSVTTARRRLRDRGDLPRPAPLGADAPTPRQSPLDPAELERALVRAVIAGARTQWRAAAWLLERRFPERWARREAAPEPPPADGFAEVDELAARRRRQQGMGPAE